MIGSISLVTSCLLRHQLGEHILVASMMRGALETLRQLTRHQYLLYFYVKAKIAPSMTVCHYTQLRQLHWGIKTLESKVEHNTIIITHVTGAQTVTEPLLAGFPFVLKTISLCSRDPFHSHEEKHPSFRVVFSTSIEHNLERSLFPSPSLPIPTSHTIATCRTCSNPLISDCRIWPEGATSLHIVSFPSRPRSGPCSR